MTLNPFAYFASERQKDREAILAALDKILTAQREQAAVAIEQARAFRSFIDSYTLITSAPISRVSNDESEAESERIQWGLHES